MRFNLINLIQKMEEDNNGDDFKNLKILHNKITKMIFFFKFLKHFIKSKIF